jgi:hypothetical protein
MRTLTPAAAYVMPRRGVSVFGPVPDWTHSRFLSVAIATRPSAYSQVGLLDIFNMISRPSRAGIG